MCELCLPRWWPWSSPFLPGLGLGDGLAQSTLGVDADDAPLELRGAAHVIARLGGLRRQSRRILDRSLVGSAPDERLLGGPGAHVGGPDARERDPGPADCPVRERHLDGDADGGKVADLALELEIGPGRA